MVKIQLNIQQKCFYNNHPTTKFITFSRSNDSLLQITTLEEYSASMISPLGRTVTFSAKADIGI
jgi:hypothetical protein